MADQALKHMGIGIDPNRASTGRAEPRKTQRFADTSPDGKARDWRRLYGGAFGSHKFFQEMSRGVGSAAAE